jgi:hypothetical protein
MLMLYPDDEYGTYHPVYGAEKVKAYYPKWSDNGHKQSEEDVIECCETCQRKDEEFIESISIIFFYAR